MIRFPPNNQDAIKWSQALLSDLAGLPQVCAEILQAIEDVKNGRIPEWSASYNVYLVEAQNNGARITFCTKCDGTDDNCLVPLEVLAAVVEQHRLQGSK